jgi:glucose/arabinose dehydrogenase
MKTGPSCLLALTVVGAMTLAACSKMPAADAGQPATSASSVAATPAVAETPAASEEKLAWLAGNWCGKDEDQQLEENWMLPQAGEAIGMSRTVQGGRMISYEFMRIAEPDGNVTLFAQPSGEAATPFARTDGGDDWIRFENKKHDYPQRIEYRKTAAGLHAEIGGPGAGDKEEVIAYDYQRCGK